MILTTTESETPDETGRRLPPGKPLFDALLAEVAGFWTPLPDKPEETAEGVVRALWLTAAGDPASVERAAAAALPALDDAAAERLRRLLARKRAGEPLAHLTGRQAFMGLELSAGPSALIPRKETEIVGRALLGKLHALARERGALRVLDLCTGSGNLALAYAHHEPGARVWGADLSADAVALARDNARRCRLDARVQFLAGDLFEPFAGAGFVGECDAVSCNPPYISSNKVPAMHAEISGFEPKMAFDGGAFGISVLTRFLREAPSYLRPASWLGLEVGAGQGPAVARQIAKHSSVAEVETHTDACGEIRAVLARTR